MISVIIPVHNASRFVRQAVTSALCQPEVSAVLLIEDGSTDDSAAVCEALAQESNKVFALHHPGKDNRGAGASRNLGIKMATTDLVAFLDADDYYLPQRFQKSMAILAKNPGVDGVYEAVEQNGIPAKTPRLISVAASIPPDRLLYALATGHSGSVHLNGITIRRSVFERTGGFPEDLPEAQDTVWILKTAATARLVGGELNQAVAVLRVHDNNRVTNRPAEQQWIVSRSLKRNQALLDWAGQNLDQKSRALIEVFTIRRLAEAYTAGIRNPLARFTLKRLRMLFYACQRPVLYFQPAFLSALLPRPRSSA